WRLEAPIVSAQGRDRLELAVTTLLRGSAGRWSLHDEKFTLRQISLLAVREFSGEVETFQKAFPSREFTGLPCGLARLRGEHRLANADFRDLRSLQEEVGELLVDNRLDDPLDLGVPQLHLGLALEMRFGDLEAEDRRQSLAGVVALEAFALL